MNSQVLDKTEIDNVVIRFAGDSGDGMQLTGTQFTNTSALLGNSLATLPDFPAEIRAPQGTIAGVSGFQIKFGETPVYTPGDSPDVLVAMNPAALKANVPLMRSGTTFILNKDAFTDSNLKKAGYESNPIDDGSLSEYNVIALPLTELTRQALESSELDARSKDRCRNLFALGVMYSMYTRPLDNTIQWLQGKFKKKPEIAEANVMALKAGFACGEATEAIPSFVIRPASIAPGTYKNISGNEAVTLGILAGSQKAGRQIFLGSYPITPASDILHAFAKYKDFGVISFQAEDEIAAICSAIGASFGGALGVTSTSGPGLNLKAEAMGLAVKTELPLVIVDVQRAGPSTGMPTKTEQSDLLCALYGRNGESPICVLAPSTPSDGFQMGFEAVRIALEHMTPVILLSDGYLANGAEPWKFPNADDLPEVSTQLIDPDKHQDEAFYPYERDENSVRKWAVPGMKGFEHRLSGLEGQDKLGTISYDPANHELMTKLRQDKIDKIAETIPPLEIEGDSDADVLLLGWGSTYGSIKASMEDLQKQGYKVALAHLKYLNPFPKNIEEVLKQFKTVIIPENNSGQLSLLVRARYMIDAQPYNKVSGQPLKVKELSDFVKQYL